MPNWKKVITSGSDAALNSLLVTNGITGSLLGTASYATNALSASYALNGGVTQLLAGPNITLSPTNGQGQVTVTATLSGSNSYNTATGSYGSFYDTTTQTNPVANIARSMSFNSTDITNGVSISGSTSPFNTYIKTENAGIYNIQFSAQVEKTDSGTDVIDIWLRKNGINLTDSATKLTLSGNGTKVVAAWNWFVSSATGDYYQIIWSSADTGMRLYAEPLSGIHPGIPSVILTANRVDQFLSNTGSFSGSFTGTLTGTASYATQALSSSYALSASHASSTAAVAGTTNYVSKFTSGTTIGDSIIFESGSNIGIGTTNAWFPSSGRTVLSINGAGSSLLEFQKGGVLSGYIYSSDSELAFSGGDSAPQAFLTSNSERMRITTGGDIGIGTTSPLTKLHVAINDNAFAGAALLENTNGNSSALSTISFKTANNASTFAVGQVNNGGGAILYNGANSSMTFSTNASTRMTITADGNVGINTTSTSHLLDINGTSMKLGNGSGASTSIYFDSGPQITSEAAIGYFKSGNVYTITSGLNSNVGIGKTSPNSVLDVNGSTIITGSLRGQVSPLSISSNTASVDLASNNFFTLNLVNGANTHINPTNIQPGQTINIRVTQGSAGTGTVSFPSFVDQASGSLYTGTAISNAIDIVTMITFDSTTVFLSSIRNML